MRAQHRRAVYRYTLLPVARDVLATAMDGQIHIDPAENAAGSRLTAATGRVPGIDGLCGAARGEALSSSFSSLAANTRESELEARSGTAAPCSTSTAKKPPGPLARRLWLSRRHRHSPAGIKRAVLRPFSRPVGTGRRNEHRGVTASP